MRSSSGSLVHCLMTEREKGTPACQKYVHDYLGCVKAVDENVGRVLDYLDRTGLPKSTLVIYTADQGMFLSEHDYFDKRWIYEECFRMPFLARLPGTLSATMASWELYDLKTDPYEASNVYTNPDYALAIKRLKVRLLELKKQYGDRDAEYLEQMTVREARWGS
jgi:hypothetical protein